MGQILEKTLRIPEDSLSVDVELRVVSVRIIHQSVRTVLPGYLVRVLQDPPTNRHYGMRW